MLTGYIFENLEMTATEPAFSVLSGDEFRCINRGDFYLQMEQLGRFLQKELGRQVPVAVSIPNSISYALSALSVLHSGNILVNINPNYTPAELLLAVSTSEPEILITSKLDESLFRLLLSDSGIKKIFFVEHINDVLLGDAESSLASPLHSCIHAGRSLPADNFRLGRSGPDDVALLQLTGGTTGAIKAVRVDCHNILSNLQQLELVFNADVLNRSRETILTVLPLYHIFAFTFNLLLFLKCRCNNILVDKARPLSILQPVFQNCAVTYFTAVGGLLKSLCQESWFVERPPRGIKHVIVGGARLDPLIADRWKKLVGGSVCEGYGLSEASPVVSINPPDGLIKVGSVGKPLPFTRVKISHACMSSQEEAQPGEICVKGPQVCEAYVNSIPDSLATFKDGWLHTGDVGFIDTDGYLFITDRLKDIIIINGFNVYPMEIESVIASIEGVLEVAVAGRKATNGNESIYAFVVARSALTADEVRKTCRTKLTGYKQPKDIIFLNELPKSPVGKILKRKLIDLVESYEPLELQESV